MKKFLNFKQIRQLLDLTEDKPRDTALFHLAFCTGFRISDLLNLKREDLMINRKVVSVLRIKTIKTDTWVERPLRDDCRQSIRKYLRKRRDINPYMFPPDRRKSRYGRNLDKPMCRATAHRLYKKYLGMIFDPQDLAGAATHTPRRSMGKIISEAAGRIEPASKFLGHKTISSTMAYIDMDSHEEKANAIVTKIQY